MPIQNPQKRQIRSFVRRQGRMTPAQKQGLDRYWSRFGLKISEEPIDFNDIFGQKSEVVLEIGFGMGDSLLAMAKANPEKVYIGIEVHSPGVGALLSMMEKEEVSNVRIYQEDAVAVLNQSIKDGSLAEINIFFPDPWPKKRHHKRRLIQPPFVELLNRKLKTGGQLHFATDWEDYAHQMMAVMSAAKGFKNSAGEGEFVKNQNVRLPTKFEKRGERLGHGVWDLIFIKSSD